MVLVLQMRVLCTCALAGDGVSVTCALAGDGVSVALTSCAPNETLPLNSLELPLLLVVGGKVLWSLYGHRSIFLAQSTVQGLSQS